MNVARTLVGLTVLLLALQVVPLFADEKIHWHSNVAQAWQRVRELDQPLLLFITTPNCGYCKLMKQQTFRDKRVINDVNQSFVPARINSQDSRKLTQYLKIRIYPSTIIIGPDRRIVEQIPGYITAGKMRTRLSSARLKSKTNPPYRVSQGKSSPNRNAVSTPTR